MHTRGLTPRAGGLRHSIARDLVPRGADGAIWSAAPFVRRLSVRRGWIRCRSPSVVRGRMPRSRSGLAPCS